MIQSTKRRITVSDVLTATNVEPALYLQEHGTSSYGEKYRKQSNRIVYDRPVNNEVGYDKAINDLMFFKEIYDKQFFE
ncbi:hypothetical protein [Paenibacillus sp. NPDC055715]